MKTNVYGGQMFKTTKLFLDKKAFAWWVGACLIFLNVCPDLAAKNLQLESALKAAYENKYQEKYTDDASVFESYKGKIMQLLGEEKNIKITHKEDLKIAEALI